MKRKNRNALVIPLLPIMVVIILMCSPINCNVKASSDTPIVIDTCYMTPHDDDGYYVDKDYRIDIMWRNYDNNTSLDDLNMNVSIEIIHNGNITYSENGKINIPADGYGHQYYSSKFIFPELGIYNISVTLQDNSTQNDPKLSVNITNEIPPPPQHPANNYIIPVIIVIVVIILSVIIAIIIILKKH